jgi:formylglycine-generating enzyme required for sulfatase activity
MKNIVFKIVLYLCISNSLTAQISLNSKDFVTINDSVSIYKMEVSNGLFHEFLQNNTTYQIDSSLWLNEKHYNKPFATYYHSHPSFKEYPVVNISYQMAVDFCNWLSKVYQLAEIKGFENVKFRLPTEEEWTTAALAKNTNAKYAWKNFDFTETKGSKNGNFYSENDSSNTSSPQIITVQKSYSPNSLGIYNMSGNVSEMILDKNITKGGDWLHDVSYCEIKNSQTWDKKAKPHIGFRMVMVRD